MLSRTAKSGNKHGVKRALSILLSGVLAITLLQAFPATSNAAPDPAPLGVDLIARYEDTNGVAASLAGSTITGSDNSTIYRLDLSLSCGVLESGPLVSNVSSPTANALVGLAEDLELQLSALRIVRTQGPEEWDMPVDCSSTSWIKAYLSPNDESWTEITESTIPQGSSNFFIGSSYALPTLTTFDTENNNFLTTSRLNTFSNGFEVEWDQFEGSIGYTPAGYSLRYREVFDGEEQRGPWIYQRSADGRQKSLVVQDPLFEGEGPAFQYEVEVAPSVIDCDSNVLFGKFESVPFVGGFGLNSDPSSLTPNIPQMIEGDVESQCFSACVPTETVAFDGEKLATILKFTSTAPCNWTVPSNFTSGTVDAYVVGGGGGGGAAGGGGGGGGGIESNIGLPVTVDDTWTVRVGSGGVGSDLVAMRGGNGASSSITYQASDGEVTSSALGGGGGGTKDNSGDSSGGDGIYTSAPLRLTYGGYGSGTGEAGAGAEGIEQLQVSSQAYGDGGDGGGGKAVGSSFIEEILASGGGGGAKCLPSGHEFYADYLGGTSQNSGIGGSCQLPEGTPATANTGGGGGGGASDGNGAGGTGGNGAAGVVYIVHTEEPLARYIPSGCVGDNFCTSWLDTTQNPDLTAFTTGAPLVQLTNNQVSNGSVLQDSIPVLQGGPGDFETAFDSITFPSAITPDSGYTLFTLARYNEKVGGQYRRIFDSAAEDTNSDGIVDGINWLSGFWGGKSGVAYHGDSSENSFANGWLTPFETSVHNKNWVLSTDQKNLYRSNGTKRSVDAYSGGVGPGQLVVNQGSRDERSDYQIADVISFDRELSETEYKAVEAYLGDRYGICVSNCSPPVFSTNSQLTDGEVTQLFTQTIVATSPDENSISYSVVDGDSLPAGLNLNATTGVLSGTPTTAGTYTFSVLATDTVNAETTQQEFSITINSPPPPQPPVFTTTSPLLSGETGTPYLQTIEAISPDGNTISYVVIDILNFPPGLTLDSSSGVFSGTPETSGTFTFTIEATDDVTGEDTRENFTIVIAPQPPEPPIFDTESLLPDGDVNQEYTQIIAATGVDGHSISYAVVGSQNLPDGLTLDETTGELSGAPTVSGNYTFTVEATDTVNLATVQKEFTITIHRVPIGCEDYSEAAFVPDNFWLDSNGYPIGCDMTGQDSVTPVVADNPDTENVVESWSQRFDSRVDLDYFNLRNGWICDDCSIGLEGEVSSGGPGPGPSPSSSSSSSATGLPLGFSFNYYGKTYNSVFVNSNGSLTFGAPSDCYNETLTQIMRCGGTSGTSAIVAYGVDLDNGYLNPDVWGNPLGPDRHTEFFYWGKTLVDGKQAFVATWMNSPGYCDSDSRDELDSELGYEYEVCDFDSIETDPFSDEFQQTLSTFQIVLIDQSSEEGGAIGDADVIINYGSMQDSQNGYTSCSTDDCQPTSDRYLAVGLGSTQVNAENSELWDSSVTSLEAVHPIIPEATLLYNGVDASLVGDLAPLALSAAKQFVGSIIPGRFVYEFRANSSPDVATPPSTPVASLGSATDSSITVTIEPPSDNGGAPVLTYGIEYRITGETDWTPVPANIQYAEPNVTFEVGGLTPATSYEVRVTANNGIGDSEPTETLPLSTKAIQGAPETPAFRSPNPFEIFDEGSVEYSWVALDSEPDSYAVRYRPTTQGSGNSLPWVTNIFISGSDAFNFGEYYTPILNPDTQYEFQISARNASGSSPWSDSEFVTTSPVEERYLETGGIVWNGYGSEISSANGYSGGPRLVYDGALKVFIGNESRSTAVQVLCDQSTISHPGFDVGVEGKQGHYEWETAETRVQGGYTVTCAPEIIDLDPGAQEDLVAVSLSRFFFTDSPWTRVMIDVTNLEESELSVGVWLESKLQSDATAINNTFEVSSSDSDPTSPATGDRWVVTGDNKESGMVVAHVFGQPLGDVDLVDSQTQEQINTDGHNQFRSEFGLDLPGTTSGKSNSARLAWFDGIVQYDVVDNAEDLAANYSSAVATAKAAAESFTKVKSQLTDTYPRFVPPTLTNFRMPDQVRVSPGVFNDLKVARISGQDPALGLSLNFNADYEGAKIPVTYKISNSAKLCIDNSLNESIFDNDEYIEEVENTSLLVKGTQAELNCFIQGLTFSIPTPPSGADSPGAYGYLYADLTELVSPRGLGEKDTKLIFEGVDAEQTLIDVEAGNATWRGVGTGINDVETRSNRNAYDEGSLEVYWIPNVNADPLLDGIEIVCPQDVDTLLTENSKAKVLACETAVVETPAGDLSIGISRSFATSDPWQQLELSIINNGGANSDVNGALAYRLDLGSDEHTEIEMTSDGDLNLESADSWFITSDNGQRTDPVLLHYVGHETGQKITQGTDADADKIWVKTPLLVAGGTTVTKRYLEGVVDAPRGKTSDAIVIAMKAADQVANKTFNVAGESDGTEDVNILGTSLSTAVNEDRDLPALRTVYECRDYAHNALGPIVLQRDGKAIGCDAFDTNEEEGPGGPGGPDGNFGDVPIDTGLFPGDQSLDEYERRDAWSRTFSSVFPNAQPRLGWACDGCIVTREGVVNLSDAVPDSDSDYEFEIPSGLPLGFSMNLGQTDSGPTPFSSPSPSPTPTQSDFNYDSIRITPYGAVQVHDSRNPDENAGHTISAFGNLAMSNGALQGNWEELPEYDFFYWGRTVYQGRLAFVVTWVKIPTVEFQSINQLDYGVPKPGLEPTSVQLMLVSDSYLGQLDEYLDADIDDRPLSNVDLIWNFSEIQSEDAVALYGDAESSTDPLQVFSGTFQFMSAHTPLFSDEMTEADFSNDIGLGVASETCDTDCVVDGLLSNKLQSPINGRYVLGYRDYFKNQEFSAGAPRGLLAPAAPRSVEVSRNDATVASLSWKAPVPWVLENVYEVGAEPIYGYRIEYAENGRGESDAIVFPALNQPPLLASDLISSPDGDETRYSLAIDELQPGEQYTFRVYAVYTGLDFPDPQGDWEFDSEIRGVPSLADERHVSDLQIVTVATDPNPMAPGAQDIAGLIAENLGVSNATINGSPYVYGETAKSIATFSGGEDSIGFDEGIVISPLTDARTFQRGSGITAEDSSGKTPSYFANPNHRAKYFETANDFNDFLNTQESWIPEREVNSVTVPGGFDSVCREEECANGTTVLQFDIEKLEENDFLKFEYALAGLETTNMDGPSDTAEVYDFPDGFGLFVGDINQESSCALVPQVGDETDAQRFMSMGNALNARLATEVEFNSDLNAETVSSVMSCNFDVSEIDAETITITMAIANANDGALSTAVFIKSESLRFEPTSINSIDIPAATQFEAYEDLQFTTSGTAPASWTASGLPDGMRVTSLGVLEGEPDESGDFDFTLRALDENDEILASQSFTIRVDRAFNGDDRFLQGNFVEVGIGGNGHFGSAGSAPIGYNPRDDEGEGRIGFISDRGKDGWGVGRDDGDFFLPGTPFEGFGIDVGGTSYFNNHRYTDIARLSELTVVTDELAQSTWISEEMPNGLQVTQVAAVPVNGQRLDVTVTLTNNSGTDLTDVYYSRQVDNDANVYACRANDGGWNSLNTVVAQADTNDGVSLVSSIMMDDCNDNDRPTDLTAPHSYLGLISTDSNSRVGIEQFGFFAKPASAFYEGGEFCGQGCDTVLVARGSNVFNDSGIGISFDVGLLPAGAFETLTFSYILSPAQAQEIIDAHTEENVIISPVLTAEGTNFSANVNKSFTTGQQSWFTATGGEISYFSVSPELPAGLSLNLSTGEISGTPTESTELAEFLLTAHNLAGTSSVEFILGVDGIEPLTCESVDGGNPSEEQDLNVLLLSKYVEGSDPDQNQTDPASDSGIARVLCDRRNPIALATTFFDGGDGGPGDWIEALTGQDVLIIPSTSDDLAGSNLMSNLALEEAIKPWMHDGGRVILTDGTNHVGELAELIDVNPSDLETRTLDGSTIGRSAAARALPTTLPLVEDNKSKYSFVLGDAALGAFFDHSPNRDFNNLYTSADWIGETFESYSVASSFAINRGEVSFLSSSFESNQTPEWDKVLLQTIYGTSGYGFSVFEADTYWYVNSEAAYWNESDSASRFEIGSGYTSHSANCLNTPTNPSIRIVSTIGTTIKCGSYTVQDGRVDGGITVQLERYFSSSSPWMKSTLNVINNDSNNPYETSMYIGGSQAQSDDFDIEASSYFPNGTTNLGQYIDGIGFAPETWTVASSGSDISIVNGNRNNPVVAQVFGATADRTQGGVGRDSWEDIGVDEIKAEFDLDLDPNETKSFSYFTGVVPFDAGCDRTAVAIAKQGAIDLQANYELEGMELGSDGWPINPELELPSLSTASCTPFNGVPTNGVAANNSSGTGVDLTWNNVQGATSYEVKYMSSGDWSPVIYVNGSGETQVSTTIYGLARNTDYIFIVRAKRSNYGSYGDNSLGDFSSGILIRTASETSSPTPTPTQSATPTPSPTPTQSATPTPSPTPTQSATPKPIVRKAQASPTVPKVLKVKKTIKFTMKTKAGLALTVSSAGACKTTKITVTKKVGKKTTTTQTGWLVTATKKGNCTVTLKAKGDTRWLPMNVKRNVKVS